MVVKETDEKKKVQRESSVSLSSRNYLLLQCSLQICKLFPPVLNLVLTLLQFLVHITLELWVSSFPSPRNAVSCVPFPLSSK